MNARLQDRWLLVLVAVVALAAIGRAVFSGTSAPIVMDGAFGDWKRVEIAHEDPSGDAGDGGIDLRGLSIANDQAAIYLRLVVGGEQLLQNSTTEVIGNDLRLFVDLDGSSSTGLPEQGLGADVEIRFGERRAFTYDEAGRAREVTLGASGFEFAPVHSSSSFEIKLPFAMAPDHVAVDDLSGGATIALLLEENVSGGDRLPDAGTLAYETSPRVVGLPRPISLARKSPAKNVRLMVMNVAHTTIAREQAVYERILQALVPDVVAFQEIYDWSAARTRRFVAAALPLTDGRRWEASRSGDTITVSSYPIVAAEAVDENLVVHIDLPDERTTHDLVLFNVHTPCCSNDPGRDREHDRIAATWRDLLAGTGPFPIEPGDAVVMAGDFNMVGYRRQLEVVRDGSFIDPANGPDFDPGRGKGSLKIAKLRHTHVRSHHTWRDNTSEYAPGKLDYVFFSKDVVRLKRGFVLDTESLPGSELESYGLEPGDSRAASDHLCLVADLRFRRR